MRSRFPSSPGRPTHRALTGALRVGLWPLLALGFFARTASAQAAADTSAPASALLGAYSEEQARRGRAAYEKNCTSCHAPTAYTGVAFRRAWAGRPVFELWEQIRTTMPNDAPGRLKPEQYADIVAYLLKLNGYPAGSTSLPADAERLQRIVIEPLPRPGS